MARLTRDPRVDRILARHQEMLARAQTLIGKERLEEALLAMTRRHPSAIRSETREVIRELTADGLTADAIAERLGLSIHYVRQIRSRTGILRQRRNDTAKRRRELIGQLSSDGISVAEIARRLKLSRSYVSQVRMGLGIAPTRKRKM